MSYYKDRAGGIVVSLSYEEKIINALSRIKYNKKDDRLTRDKKDFDIIREILKPLYDKITALEDDIQACRNGGTSCSKRGF